MSTPVRRMTHYQGLAQGQGPVTMNTSPLWSPYGPYSMNRNQFGAVAYQGFYGEADGAEEGMMGTLKEYYNKAMAHQTMGYSTVKVLGGAYLAYILWMNRGRFMPMRANRWDAMSSVPGVAQNMAKLRWARAAGNDQDANMIERFFANLAGMKVTDWRARRAIKSYGPYGSRRSTKPAGLIETIVDVITPEMAPTEKTRKPSRKKTSRKKTSRKALPATRLTRSSASLKGLRQRAMKLAPKYGLKQAWVIAKDEVAYANVRGNPKRRKARRRRNRR